MRNRFENIFGRLFRACAKSMIEEISKLYFDNKELLSIGVLQYSPYDNSFRYAPTLRNIFITPDQVGNNFPTTKQCLWNYRLMIKLAKYLFTRRQNDWIKNLFLENEELAKNKASIFAASYDNYKDIRQSWYKWYKQNIDKFEELTEESDKMILNQLFHFANFLIVIAKWPAFISKSPNTFADFIYTCINKHEFTERFPKIFDKYKACLSNGIHIKWKSNLNGQIHKAELLYVLEICFKQPFNTGQKIEIIDKVTNERKFEGEYYINATAKPIIANGDFLGISYIAWPSISKEESKKSYQKINNKINEVFQASRIEYFLFKSRIATARFYLQDINPDNIQNPTIYRLFQLTHILSSSHLVAYFDEEDVYLRFLTKYGNYSKYKEIKHSKTKPDFIKFLSENTGRETEKLLQQDSFWIDVAKEEIKKDNETKKNYDKIKNDIELFNTNLKKYISDNDFNKSPSYQITNITFHNFMYEGKKCGLVFFNSNFYQLFCPTPNLRKQSYAYDIYNSLSELIEDENIHRVNYMQEREAFKKASEEMERGFVHFAKSILVNTYDYVINMKTSESIKLSYYNKVIDSLVKKLTKYLTVYSSKYKKNTLTHISDIIECWNRKCKEYK